MPTIAEEAQFQDWYRRNAASLGLDPNPDAPEHFYDWRSAFKAGATPDRSGHWPSQFKLPGHPNRYVEGMDTMTNMPDFRNVQPGYSSTTNPSVSQEILRQMNRQPRMGLQNRGYEFEMPPEGANRDSLRFQIPVLPRPMVPIRRR